MFVSNDESDVVKFDVILVSSYKSGVMLVLSHESDVMFGWSDQSNVMLISSVHLVL